MKNKLAVVLSGLMFLGGSHAAAQEAQPLAAEPAQEAAAETSEPVNVGNKICPVSGQEVGSMGEGAKVIHKGKIYNLCCPGCIKDFNKDPEKYSKIADDMVASQAPEETAQEETQDSTQ